MVRRRRWGLILLSVFSLVILVYAGVFTAFSVTVTNAMEKQSRLPGATEPVAGTRALVFPVTDPTLIPTIKKPGTDGSPNGSLLMTAAPGSSFPASATNVTLERALAFVAPTANGTYEPATLSFTNLTYADGNATAFESVNIDVASLANGKAGFLVKTDAGKNVTFVSTDSVVGTVARFDSAGLVYALFALGGVGFIGPIVAIIVTHRGTAAAGVAGVTAGMCRECRSPLEPGATFCTRCGAWQERREN